MLYGAQTGENSALSPFKMALNDGDIVELVITNIGLPYSYKAQIEEANQKIIEEGKKSGIEDPMLHPTYKEGGLALDVVAIGKVDSDGIETDFSDSLSIEKGLYHTIIMPTPLQFLERGYDLKDVRRGGKIIQGPKDKPFIGVFSKEGSVIIDDIYPSPNVEAFWSNGTVVKTADDISDDDLLDEEYGAEYGKVLNKEEKRKESWAKMQRLWASWTEVEARNFLMLAVSSRFLLHTEGQSKGAEYHLPRVGMRFYSKVKRSLDKEGKVSKYVNFIPFEWNKDERGWNCYSTGTLLPTEDEILYTEDLKSQQIICFSS